MGSLRRTRHSSRCRTATRDCRWIEMTATTLARAILRDHAGAVDALAHVIAHARLQHANAQLSGDEVERLLAAVGCEPGVLPDGKWRP